MSAPSVRILHADAVLPGDQPAIVDGAVVVDADYTVLDLGLADELCARHAGAPVERIVGALGPGLINAHTHLELSGLRGRVSGGAGFVPWVESMLPLRASQAPERNAEAIERAVDEIDRAGTAAVADVGNTQAAADLLARRGVGGMVFHELFGMARERGLAGVAALRAELEAIDARAGGPVATEGLDLVHAPAPHTLDLVHAPAPHTLYTTHAEVVRALVALARARGTRGSVHLAEHPAERAFLEKGEGPFLSFVRRTPVFSHDFVVPNKGPVDWAADLGLLAPDLLLVHLTDARRSEIARVAASGAHVVLCPRSNAYIEGTLPRLPDWLEAGVVPALGTDSLASNTSLDVLAEANALAARWPSVSPRTLFEMATAAGARALGRADLGRIAKGTRPGLVAFDGAVGGDPFTWAMSRPPELRRWVARRRTP